MRLARFILSTWCCLAASAAEDVRVTVTANRGQMYLGESFILDINVAGAGSAEADLSSLTNAQVRPLGQRTVSNMSLRFENGRMVREGFSGVILSFEITPANAGLFAVGRVAVTADGRACSADGPSVTVTDVEAQDLVHLSIQASRQSVIPDEPFDITLRIRIRKLPAPNDAIEPLFTDQPPQLTIPWLSREGMKGLAGPDLNEVLNRLLVQNDRPGFAVNDYERQPDPFDFESFFSGRRRLARFAFDRSLPDADASAYVEYRLTLTYTPQDEGHYVFGPVVFKGAVPAALRLQGQAEGRHIFAVGPACTVRVVPPPAENRPASFTGAIGSNLTVRARVDASVCSLGDPLTLTLEVGGAVRLDKVLPPKLAAQAGWSADFTVYDNTVETVPQSDSRRFIYTLRPNRAGRLMVPPIEVAYYDLGQREYRVSATDPIPIEVKPGAEVTASHLVGHTNRLNGAGPGEDLRTARPAAPRQDPAGADPAPLLGQTAWLLAAACSPALYGAIALGFVLRSTRARRRAAWRRRRALARARRRLAALSRLPSGAAPDSVCAVIRQYLSDRLGVPTAGLTPDDLPRLLREAGAPAGPAGALAALYEPWFNAGFSGVPPPGAPAADAAAVERLLADLDRSLRAAPRTTGEDGS